MDASTVSAFTRREPSAVRVFYAEYGRLVYVVAFRVLRDHALAEEATQQTFVRAWQAADHLDQERDPVPWLATIAKRVAIDIHRREARRYANSLENVLSDDPAVIELPPDLEVLDRVWRVRRAIDDLPPEEATIMRLQHLDGLTHTEIAEKLGVALGTVKSRSHRAHTKLATALRHLQEQA